MKGMVEECATCHQAEDLVAWRARLLCDSMFRKKNDIDYVYRYLLLDRLPDNCRVEFNAPDAETTKAANALQCTDKAFTVDKCTESTFPLPEGCPFTVKEVILACESGFRSSFYGLQRHANIFCAICSGIYINTIELCPDEGDGRGITYSLSIVLDTELLSRFTKKTRNNHIQKICRKGTNDCKTVLCPTGKLYNQDGVCQFPSPDWKFDVYKASLQLTPLTHFTRTMVTAATEYWKVVGAQNAIVSPFDSTWAVVQFYTILRQYKGEPESRVASIAASFVCTNTKLNGAQLLDQVLQAVTSKKWYYRADGVNIAMSARFSSYLRTSFVYGGRIDVPMYMKYAPNATNAYLVRDAPVKFGDKLDTMGTSPVVVLADPISITRLFYCKQIQLQRNEYTKFREDAAIYHKAANRLYLDGEFNIVEDSNGGKVARVCLKDSVYGSAGNTLCPIPVCWFALVQGVVAIVVMANV